MFSQVIYKLHKNIFLLISHVSQVYNYMGNNGNLLLTYMYLRYILSLFSIFQRYMYILVNETNNLFSTYLLSNYIRGFFFTSFLLYMHLKW